MNGDILTNTPAVGIRGRESCVGSLSVFFPAFNDASALPALIEMTYGTLCVNVPIFEIIVVNDGSADNTAEVLSQLEERYAPHLRVITHAQNLGYGAALRSGFQAAKYEYIFYTDGDGQYDPRELERLLREAQPGVCLVNGYKTKRNDPPHRIAIGWLYNHFARWLFRIRLRDIDCDFRLIHRSAFDPSQLRSTGGTICVELVRNLEMSGQRVVEVPVSHYAREHGRSQFFRVRSLAITFLQMCQVFCRLVLAPCIFGTGSAALEQRSEQFSTRRTVAVLLALVVLCVLAYGRALSLPFIADDYIQIQLGRDYGPWQKWGALARDALYRCRATSILLTYWLDQAVGLNSVIFNLTGLVLHIANCFLVFALGVWKPIGWRISALAAAYFAFSQRHSEAVIWFAAVPELLVFFFVLTGLLLWIRWLQADRPRPLWVAAAFGFYVLALLSKESAVALVPLCSLAVVFDDRKQWRRLWTLVPFALTGAVYFAFIYAARDTHLHFNDGTFSLSAPFPEVIARSSWGLLWVWGVVCLVTATFKFLKLQSPIIPLGLVWIVLALLPYSFLTYMPRVPSRHTYIASVGVALIVGASFLAFRNWAQAHRKQWLIPALAAVLIAHECGYLWTVIQGRYVLRAAPTEQLLQAAREGSGDIYASCFPYSPYVAEYALMVTMPGEPRPKFLSGPEPAKHSGARDFCNSLAEGARF
jgi:hypothetical protein